MRTVPANQSDGFAEIADAMAELIACRRFGKRLAKTLRSRWVQHSTSHNETGEDS